MMLQPLFFFVTMTTLALSETASAAKDGKDCLVERMCLGACIPAWSPEGWVAANGQIWDPFNPKTKVAFLDGIRVATFTFGENREIVYAMDVNGDCYRWKPGTAKSELLF